MTWIVEARFSNETRQVRQFARTIAEDTLTIVAIANCYHGFYTWSAQGASAILDRFEAGWAASFGSLDVRLTMAFDSVLESAPRILDHLYTDPEEPAAGSLLVVGSKNREAVVGWIGEAYACLLRHGAVIADNAPHTLRRQARAPGVPRERVAELPDVVTSTIPRGARDIARWTTLPGDKICATSSEPRSIPTTTDRADLARRLVRELDSRVGAIACVLDA